MPAVFGLCGYITLKIGFVKQGRLVPHCVTNAIRNSFCLTVFDIVVSIDDKKQQNPDCKQERESDRKFEKVFFIHTTEMKKCYSFGISINCAPLLSSATVTAILPFGATTTYGKLIVSRTVSTAVSILNFATS